MAKDLDYYLNGTYSDALDELNESFESGIRQRRRTKKTVDEELGDEQTEYNDWSIFDR